MIEFSASAHKADNLSPADPTWARFSWAEVAAANKQSTKAIPQNRTKDSFLDCT